MKAIAALILGACAAVLTAAPVDAETVLRIYSATDTTAVTEVISRFEAAYPGVRVEYVEFNTSELYAAIATGSAAADVVISSSMDLQAKLVNSGMAFAFRPPNADTLPDWAQWRGELYGFTWEPVVMTYNKRAFANRPLPHTRSELAGMIRDDPEFFRGRIGTYDVSLSGVGYLFATQDAQRGYQFSRLAESLGRARVRTFCCTNEVLERVASGELVYGYNMIGSYALGKAREDKRLGLYLLDDYTLVMTRTAFIPETAPNKRAAVAFINFLLSPEGQAAIAASPSMLPLLAGAPGAETQDWLLRTEGRPLLPIRIGPGLLTYLDTLKKASFLADWSASMQIESPSR
ncbi:ABC transporter substrate-binding protein [Stappia sp. ICDLI1TA098]